MKGKILKIMAYALSAVTIMASGAASVGCLVIFWDEPYAPNSLIEE